ncbi:MAG: transcriptional regulator, TetR family [Solirubrobacterales bacterium]|nr:transcriptional regulator, TetR family [Solirubrobacterales bacterium]
MFDPMRGASSDTRVPPDGRSAADVKRSDLVRHAAELFDTHGYHQTSVADIAAAAGIQKSTLYHYVKSKQDLLFWIHETFADEMLARIESRADTPMTGRQRLLESMGDVLEVVDSHRGHVRAFWEHHRELGPEQQERISQKRAVIQAHLRSAIQECVDSGEFRDLDVKMATFAAFGMVNWSYQWYKPDGPRRPRDIAFLFWDFIVRGFDAPATKP